MKKETDKTPQLKGQEAEDKVLQYMKQCNRPYGAADVSANLMNAVSKPAAQKILAQLGERDLIAQKLYGKTTYYVAKQSDSDDMSAIELDVLESSAAALGAEQKQLTTQQKETQSELNTVRVTPSDDLLIEEICRLDTELDNLKVALAPLRMGVVIISEREAEMLDLEWFRWKSEWQVRKLTFERALNMLLDAMSPTNTSELMDNLGLETDGPEHIELQRSHLYQAKAKGTRTA